MHRKSTQLSTAALLRLAGTSVAAGPAISALLGVPPPLALADVLGTLTTTLQLNLWQALVVQPHITLLSGIVRVRP